MCFETWYKLSQHPLHKLLATMECQRTSKESNNLKMGNSGGRVDMQDPHKKGGGTRELQLWQSRRCPANRNKQLFRIGQNRQVYHMRKPVKHLRALSGTLKVPTECPHGYDWVAPRSNQSGNGALGSAEKNET